jgi:DNA-binding response OmpR family regulator
MSRVLIIDDSEDMRSVLAEILSAEGYEASAVADGATGLAEAATVRPDLILCDIMMPGLSGYDVLRALRREPQTAVIPVIFLTGVGGSEAQRAGMNLGADDYLVKPVSRDVLLETVARGWHGRQPPDERRNAGCRSWRTIWPARFPRMSS